MTGSTALPGLYRRLLRRFGTTFSERVYALLTLVCIAIGIALRTRGMFGKNPLPFWLDEASWAVFLVEVPLTEQSIRPIGFMAVSRVLGAISMSEPMLRSLSWAAGIATAVLAPFLARRLFDSKASRLLFVAVLALHPGAIDLAREFKPYAVSLFVHALLLFAALRYVRDRRRSSLVFALCVLPLAVLFAQDTVFAYPGAFLVMGIAALRAGLHRQLAAIAGGAVLTIGVVLTLYFVMWSRMPESDRSDFWGKKYSVFYIPDERRPEHTFGAWLSGKYTEMITLPGLRRTRWGSEHLDRSQLKVLRGIDEGIWVVLHGLGLVVLVWRRKYTEGVLLVLPIAVLIAFNVLGYWPLGAFRTNLFLVAYMAGIAATALDRPRPEKTPWAAPVPAIVLVLAPFFAFERNYHADKLYFGFSSDFPKTLEKLARFGSNERRTHMLLTTWSCGPWKYYTELHPETSRAVGRNALERFETECLWTVEELRDRLGKDLRKPGDRRLVLASRNGMERTRSRQGWARKVNVRKLRPSGHSLQLYELKRTR